MAACAYAVSGDVMFPESPESSRNLKAGARSDNSKDSNLEVSTGSVVMFPDSTRGAPRGRYACNESFLYVVPPEELIAERLQRNNLLLAAAVCVRRLVDALARAPVLQLRFQASLSSVFIALRHLILPQNRIRRLKRGRSVRSPDVRVCSAQRRTPVCCGDFSRHFSVGCYEIL